MIEYHLYKNKKHDITSVSAKGSIILEKMDLRIIFIFKLYENIYLLRSKMKGADSATYGLQFLIAIRVY